MKEILTYLIENKTFSESESRQILTEIATGKYSESEVAAFISIFWIRPITLEELKGFRLAMLDLCIPLNTKGTEVIDLCGTGGDEKNTFNISTLSAFVVAGTGIKVAKHGNYSVSSISGSSNILEYFGYKFTNKADSLLKSLENLNLCFLHAPLFHPAMKHVAPIRKSLNIKTFFNLLGPISNPVQPKNQLIGVYNLAIGQLYNYLYQDLKKQYTIVHSLDGYDEISLTGDFKLFNQNGERYLNPNDLGLPVLSPKSIYGGKNLKEAAKIFENVLKNEGTKSQKQVVVVNSAFAIKTVRPNLLIENCFQMAKESLESGRALNILKRVVT